MSRSIVRLERLQVAHVDLLQLHNLVDPQEWDIASGPGGALEAAIEAASKDWYALSALQATG